MTKPETAYDLLALVALHIEEEPKRYNQNVWALIGEVIEKHLGAEMAPSCGTVCCRAGWIVALHDGPRSPLLLNQQRSPWPYAISDRALTILGLDEGQVGYLFDGFPEDEDEAEWSARPFVDAKPGTVEYAKAGADGLRAFMAGHEAHLKARRLSDVPPAEDAVDPSEDSNTGNPSTRDR